MIIRTPREDPEPMATHTDYLWFTTARRQEFIRITDRLLPARSFTRIVPELRQHGRTAAGVPVLVVDCHLR